MLFKYSPVFYLDDCDEKPLLILLVHSSADGSYGPAQCVEVLPGPLGTIHLVMELLRHNAFCVRVVQMSQVHYVVAEEESHLHGQSVDSGSTANIDLKYQNT